MWDGETSKKKKISLGGKKKAGTNLDKEDTLRKAAEERESRARYRREVNASSSIQRHYKSYRELVVVREDVRLLLDKKIADIMQLVSVLATAGVKFLPPCHVLVTILREYLFGKKQNRR